MLKGFFWALPATVLLATSAVSHPEPEAHICGIDPDTMTVWPGYGTVGPVYDRGTNFFTVERTATGVIHHRLYKDECNASSIRVDYGSDNDISPSEAYTGFWGLKIQSFYYNSANGDWNTTTQRTIINEFGEITEQKQVESQLTSVNGLNQWVDYQTTDYVAGVISQTVVRQSSRLTPLYPR